MTQRELRHRGGSEMFSIEVAVELSRRGNDVAVYSPRFGDLAKFMLAGGVWVKSRLSDLPWVPEVIHGQHHLQAVAAMTRFEAGAMGPEIDSLYVKTVHARSLQDRIHELEREVRVLRLRNKARQLYLRPFRRLLGKFHSIIT
jgi:hypothetical protein